MTTYPSSQILRLLGSVMLCGRRIALCLAWILLAVALLGGGGIRCAIAAQDTVAMKKEGGTTSEKTVPETLEITADQSLEWHEVEGLYVARGKARAVRGEWVIDADILTAHARQKKAGDEAAKTPGKKSGAVGNMGGDIDVLSAEGNVHISDPTRRISGQRGVYDLDQHVAMMTGGDLKYETENEQVTARDSLEYWEDKKMAVARGDAKAVSAGRHVAADILTATFYDKADGRTDLSRLTADGHVVIITPTDVTRGDHAVYDAVGSMAIVRGNVRITRQDGTELSGDVGEVDLKSNRSRLMKQTPAQAREDGHNTKRVRALLPIKEQEGVHSGNQGGGKSSTLPLGE